MIVKLIDAPAVAGGKALALCGDDGKPLANQKGAVVENFVGRDLPEVTVTFLVDGRTIRFE